MDRLWQKSTTQLQGIVSSLVCYKKEKSEIKDHMACQSIPLTNANPVITNLWQEPVVLANQKELQKKTIWTGQDLMVQCKLTKRNFCTILSND